MQSKLLWSQPQTTEILAYALKQGQLVVGSSDTVLGFLADVTPAGFARLNSIKQRAQKPYLILIGSKDKIDLFASMPLSGAAQKLVAACWPGPLTLIIKASEDLPDFMISPLGTVAIRMPAHDGLLELLQQFDGLFSTSANLTGQPVPATLEQLDARIIQSLAYIVDDAKPQQAEVPSTIIDCSKVIPVIVREGAYSRTLLAKVLGTQLQ
jgi:L-threonylcarbamoyladenylate synthase